MSALVAIVGRPNVGKSTLFNRLAGRSLALVHDTPGVTRDRHYASIELRGRELTLVDTGGFDPQSDQALERSVARQVEIAIEEADLVLCLLDGSCPPTATDRLVVERLRRSAKSVLYVANKVDQPARAAEAFGYFELGLGQLCCISALHGRGLAELEAALLDALPAGDNPPELEEPDLVRVTLIGRPNAGKSSLLNFLAGTERTLVDERPGTTRDPVDTRIQHGGYAYLVVDTAGIRRRSRVASELEAASVLRALRAATRAQVVILVCDASAGVSEQDARLLGLCLERGRAAVVGLNKQDLLDRVRRRTVVADARQVLAFAPWVPIVPLSAVTGAGVEPLMREVRRVAESFQRRIATAELNRLFEQVLLRHPPPTHAGRAPRLYYITQTGVAPPVFVVMASAPQAITPSYQRFVANQIRKAFGFEGVPLVIRYRARRRGAA